MKNIKLVTLCSLLLLSIPALSAEYTVKMLNSGVDGMMVFEPGYLSINKGDTVKFEATDKAHNSASARGLIPEGATPWMGRMSQDISVTFDTEGVYIYECTPHKMMAMIGVIKVGNPTNLADIKAKSMLYKKGFVMNPKRLDKYLSNVEG